MVPEVPPLEIRVLPLTSRHIHRGEGHVHAGMDHDYIEKGVTALGPLSYGLLRAEAMTLHRHRAMAVRAVLDRFQVFADDEERIAQVDAAEATKFRMNRPGLILWDLVGLVGETCEQLAAMFTAVRAWDVSQTHIGLTLLNFQTSTSRVLQSTAFQDETWWAEHLGARPDPDRMSRLSPTQRRMVKIPLGQVQRRIPIALASIRNAYTEELHRVAMRRKHVLPLLDANKASVFGTGDADTDKWLMDQVERGALVLADDKVRSGQLSQIVMPLDNIEGLIELCAHANWLSGSIAGATLSRVEHTSGVPWSWDYDADPMPDDPVEDVLNAMYSYLGTDPEAGRSQLEVELRTAKAWEAAHSAPSQPADEPSINRAERRRREREDHRRR